MNRIKLLALLGIIITSGGCDGTPTEAVRQGRMDAVLDGQPWAGNAQSDVLGETIHVHSDRRDAPHQQLRLEIQETAPGVYTLVTGSQHGLGSGYWEIFGGDVIGYHAAVTSGTVSIEHIDRASGAVTGTVSLTLQGPRGTSRLEQGRFQAVSWRQPGQR
ncbi:MAG TPA: hypothetical protein VHG93_05650 [Longimicrobium sp.]|nr:hypothetical protein [Longimicrobium sp.]